MEQCDCGCDKNGWKTINSYSDLVWKCFDTTSGYFFDDGRKEEEGYSPLWGRPIRFTTSSGKSPWIYRRIILWSNNEFSEDGGYDPEELSDLRTPKWEIFDKNGGEFLIDDVYKSEEDYHEGIHNLDNFNLYLDPEHKEDIINNITYYRKWDTKGYINIQTLIHLNLLQIRCSSYYK